MSSRLVIGSSLIRDIRYINDTDIYSLRGAKVEDVMTVFSKKHETTRRYDAVFVLCGGNNIEVDPPDEIIRKLHELTKVILSINPKCIIIISSLIPRPRIDDNCKQKFIETNRLIQLECPKWDRTIFSVPTYKLFVSGGNIVHNYFCSDAVHLNIEGYKRLKQYICQMLSKFAYKPRRLVHGETHSYHRRDWSNF